MIAVIGLLIGVFLGLLFDVNIPEKFSPYMSIAILACLDSVIGALGHGLIKILNLIYSYQASLVIHC